MVHLTTSTGERIVIDAETAEYLLSPDHLAVMLEKLDVESRNAEVPPTSDGLNVAGYNAVPHSALPVPPFQ